MGNEELENFVLMEFDFEGLLDYPPILVGSEGWVDDMFGDCLVTNSDGLYVFCGCIEADFSLTDLTYSVFHRLNTNSPDESAGLREHISNGRIDRIRCNHLDQIGINAEIFSFLRMLSVLLVAGGPIDSGLGCGQRPETCRGTDVPIAKRFRLTLVRYLSQLSVFNCECSKASESSLATISLNFMND